MNYASFFKRVIAALIDAFIVGSISIVINRFIFIGWIISLFLGAFYYIFFLSSKVRATPGKFAMGISVSTLNGERLTNRTAIIRYAISIVSGVLLCFGYLMALFTEKKQTLHDLFAGTIVVEEVFTSEEGLFMAWINQIKSLR